MDPTFLEDAFKCALMYAIQQFLTWSSLRVTESCVWDKFNSIRTHCIKGSSREKVGLLLALCRPTQH